MNSFLKANPLILSFLIIIGFGLNSNVSAQIVATGATICEDQTATVTAVGACPLCVIEWHSEFPIAPGSLVGTGPSFTSTTATRTEVEDVVRQALRSRTVRGRARVRTQARSRRRRAQRSTARCNAPPSADSDPEPPSSRLAGVLP